MHLYERIFEDLRRIVDEGDVAPGDRLPSIRDVAERYDCNKLTAQKAFDLLVESGRAENRIGSGTFVRAPAAPDSEGADFASARLSESFFPYEEAGAILAGLLATEKERIFSAPEPRGDSRLIEALARYFRLPADSLLVTSGGQQGLDLVRRYFATRAGAFAVAEDPTYPGALSTFKPKRMVAFGGEGPDPEGLAAAFADAPAGGRFFYSVPQINNPSGLSHSKAVKQAIAEAAERLDFMIVEDDYLSELLEAPLPRYVDLAPRRTIWIKSLSKTLTPGIRIGALAVAPERVPGFLRLRGEGDPGPSMWLQLFAAAILESGLYDRHLARVRQISDRRREELERAMAGLAGLRLAGGRDGYNLWLESAKAGGTTGATRGTVPARGAQGTVPVGAEGWRFGRSEETRRCFRLSTMGLGERDWPRAVENLLSVLGAGV